MRFKGQLEEALQHKLPSAALAELPSGYQAIGSIALLRLKPALARHGRAIACAMHERYPQFTAIGSIGPVRGELRVPTVRLLWGRSLRTVHREHGCWYALDARTCLFSKGNVNERHRIRPRQGEVIADLFAGIGYFSIPLAKAGATVYAIEKNPEAFRFLVKNRRLNRASIIPILGDCRRVRLPEPVDRVVLGYFPRTERFLPAAFAACKPRALLHFHSCYPAAALWAAPERQLRTAARRAGFSIRIVGRRVVKSISPTLRHVALDVAVSRRRRNRAGRAPAARRARP